MNVEKLSGNSVLRRNRRFGAGIGAVLLLGLVGGAVASQPPDPTNSDIYGNTAAGSNALLNLYSSSFVVYNTAVGFDALRYFNGGSGNNNTAIGAFAMENSTNTTEDTYVGANAGDSDSAGYDNTAVGYNAGSTSFSCSALGAQANCTAGQGIAVGVSAIAQGSHVIAIGVSAGSSAGTGSNNILIGNVGVSGDSGAIRLGTSGTQTAAYIAGVSGVTVSGGADVVIGSNGQLGTVVSSAQYKKDIQDMGDDSARLAQLRPVTFHYKADPAQEKQYGLIAEEVAQVYPDLVVRDQQGKVQSVQYHALIPMLLNELQRQQREVQALRDENAGLRTALQTEQAQTQARLTRLEQQVTHSAVVASR